ncbi:hypothetical protein B0O99DRAFT_590980 [Bisporella sp. PMI_857]|nr:hypothetical protein B0O99DRAFT_590980 [Bisporella sp. PMI_857]
MDVNQVNGTLNTLFGGSKQAKSWMTGNVGNNSVRPTHRSAPARPPGHLDTQPNGFAQRSSSSSVSGNLHPGIETDPPLVHSTPSINPQHISNQNESSAISISEPGQHQAQSLPPTADTGTQILSGSVPTGGQQDVSYAQASQRSTIPASRQSIDDALTSTSAPRLYSATHTSNTHIPYLPWPVTASNPPGQSSRAQGSKNNSTAQRQLGPTQVQGMPQDQTLSSLIAMSSTSTEQPPLANASSNQNQTHSRTASNPHKRQRVDRPAMISLKPGLELIEQHIKGSGGWENLNTALERPRFQLLQQACREEDQFYVAFHQIFCLWTTRSIDLLNQGLSLPHPSILNLAFRTIGTLIRENEALAPNHLRFFQDFPGPLPDLLRTTETYPQHVNDVIWCLNSLASNWQTLTTASRNRGFPPLVNELATYLGLNSPILQSIAFTAARRNLGFVDTPAGYGQKADALFKHDTEGRNILLQRIGAANPAIEAEMNKHNSSIAQQYLQLMNLMKQNTGQPPRNTSIPSPLVTTNGHLASASTGPTGNSVVSNSSPTVVQINQTLPSPNISGSTSQFPNLTSQSYGNSPSTVHNMQSLSMNSPNQSPQLSNQWPSMISRNNSGQAQQSSPQTSSAQFVPSSNIAQGQHRSSPGQVFAHPRSSNSGQGQLLQGHNISVPNSAQPSRIAVLATQYSPSTNINHANARRNSEQQAIIARQQAILAQQQQNMAIQAVQAAQYREPLPQMIAQQANYPLSTQHMQQQNLRQAQQHQQHTHRQQSVTAAAAQNQGLQRPSVVPSQTRNNFAPGQPISVNSRRQQLDPIEIYTKMHPLERSFIPPLGYMHPSQPVNPDLTALHQAHLRSPKLFHATLGLNSSKDGHSGRFYQVIKDFALEPVKVPGTRPLTKVRFDVSLEDYSLIAKDVWVEHDKIPVRHFKQGTLQYRMRCILTKAETTKCTLSEWVVSDTVWPETIFATLNGYTLEFRKKQQHGKDLPVDLTRGVRSLVPPSVHHLTLSTPVGKKPATRFYLAAVEMIEIMQHDQIMSMCQQNRIASEIRLEEMKMHMAPSANEDDDVAIVISDISIDLADPFTARIFEIPVKGQSCLHRECFDLETFLITRSAKQKRPNQPCMIDQWKCPLCSRDARPYALQVDDFLVSVRAKLAADNNLEVKAILVSANGEWRPKPEPQPQRRGGMNDLNDSDSEPDSGKKSTMPTNNAFALPQHATPQSAEQSLAIQQTLNFATGVRPSAVRAKRPAPQVIEIDSD